MKKLLIFGYSGFVGPYLAKQFANDGYEVFGSDLIDKNSDRLLSAFLVADVTKKEQVEFVINSVQPNVIVNLAAISSVGQSWKMPDTTILVNVIGSLNILQVATKLDEKPKIMFVGSSEEFEASDKPIGINGKLNSNNPYGLSKLIQERFAELYRKQYGLKIYCVRPFNHIGIGQRDSFVIPSFCKQVAEIERSGKSDSIYVGDISVYRDFSDVRDVTRAYKMIVDSDDDDVIYNVGSGKAYQIKELLEYIISLSNQKINIAFDQERYRPLDTPFICCDYSKIKEDLGWEPEYDIKETIKELYFHYLNGSDA